MGNDNLNTHPGIDCRYDQYTEEALFRTTLKNLCTLLDEEPKSPLINGYVWILKKQNEIWQTRTT